ncbi:protein timeless isoform X2 [Bombyx mandarina]|uniref:Protein timeless isoform X2 n=1 Tax=Bombyx mandarina TaxID=7092 RepID=A0A6J2KL68_BOMMA|nr:protein timeless isoform X2 [Bombyx mandarina]
MEWVLRSPQIHSSFGNLGFLHADGYHVNENCNNVLESILHNILSEDEYLRTYRRSISFGQNVKKDLIPLLIHTKDDKTIELLIRILVNLTIPIECLLSVDEISKNDFGRHTIFEINNLLATTKMAFTDQRATKVVIDFLKKNFDLEQKTMLTIEQCTNISNSLLLLRNILHIPEKTPTQSPTFNGPVHSIQNQIIWNIFSQSIDKVLIKLMIIPDAAKWAVTMIQFIALLYKNQHAVTLHKLLNLWLESSLSESSEDNESNTSPPDRGSDDSSPILTSDPTSDSSDTGGSGKSNDEPNSVNNGWDASSVNNTSENGSQTSQTHNDSESPRKNAENIAEGSMKDVNEAKSVTFSESNTEATKDVPAGEDKMKAVISENSDCGYGTQIENQESVSTSSNDDELPSEKPVHQKPHNPKQRVNTKSRSGVTVQERKRKKIVKRGKSNIINVQGLSHKTPTDDDISNILKEFTVDFLLKGYNVLVQTLHSQILTNLQLEIDTSHFFWLVTYFLKFATQIELDLEHLCSVLSFDIVSYLTAEGVNLCEQFELAVKLDGNGLKPCMRRLHLVVTAIRELVQAIEVYKKISFIRKDDREALIKLQIKMCETDELRSLMVLLLRTYNPKYHTKQYLQDIIVTNHILLLFLDNVMKMTEYNGTTNMVDHIKQFATPEIMYQYGLLLEDYASNGEFVNDCIFTVMHHAGGELESLITLFQPKILKTFTSIWKSEFEICDDWSDLIEYVINTFIKKPHTLQTMADIRLDTENFDDEIVSKPVTTPEDVAGPRTNDIAKKNNTISNASNASVETWTEDELSSLNWNYMQCNSLSDVIGEIVKLFKDYGTFKSRQSIITQLYKQNIIDKDKFETFLNAEKQWNTRTVELNKETRDDEIGKLCEQLANDGKSNFLDWVQKVLLDTCCAKIYIQKKSATKFLADQADCKLLNFELFKKKSDFPSLSPVSCHSLLFNQSVPLVPWNCRQASICKDLKFLQLLHKLGFHMPVDSGKVFIRIPHFWTADFLFEVAGKIAPIDKKTLKFNIDDLQNSMTHEKYRNLIVLTTNYTKDITMVETSDNIYQVHKQKHLATMVNFTPMPGTSFGTQRDDERRNWLEVVKKSQEYKITLNLGRLVGEEDDIQPDVVMKLPSSEPSESLPAPPISGNITDTEYYNNSVCETASVASDLTRMYVSDEDEKPEVVLRPVHEVNNLAESSDSGNLKRPRVQFAPNF